MLTALVEKGLPRQEAYVMVQRCAMNSWENELPFPDIVRRDEAISARLNPEELDSLFDPRYYIRYESLMLDRVFRENAF